MITATFGTRADGRPLTYRAGTHLLCTGCSGAGKSKTADALLYSLLADNPEEEMGICILNPKMVGFEWAAESPRVRLFDDLNVMESVWQAVWSEIQRRYTLMEVGADGEKVLPRGVGTLFVFTDELPSLVSSDGALVQPASSKAIRDNMTKTLRLGRMAGVNLVSFSQFCDGTSVGGTGARALYDSRIVMRVMSNSEVSMATGMAESEISDNLSSFLPGEVLARTVKGEPFVRGWADYRTDGELLDAVRLLPDAPEPDFGFLARRGLA